MMAEPIQFWRDARGFLHSTPESADASDVEFEITQRRDVVRDLLVKRIKDHGGLRLLGHSVSSHTAADWLIANWPALRAIGFAYRVHELGPDGEIALDAVASGGRS